jgi:putative transposase
VRRHREAFMALVEWSGDSGWQISPGYARLCRGGGSSLTFPAVHRRSSNVSSHSHERNSTEGRVQEPNHTTWDCKYYVVFIPECRRKTLYQEVRRHLGEMFRTLALQRESKIEEGHLMPDHVHMLLSIPPKFAVSQVVGYVKGKSAIHLARVYGERKRNFVGQHFWPGLFRQHGRSRRGRHPGTSATKRRKTRGSNS